MVESLQSWDPDEYDEKAGFVAELGAPVMALLEPQAGERILDLGCGDGVLTERLIAAGCQVVGIDGSEAQVEAARRRGVDARVMGAHALPLTGRSTRSSAMRHSTG